MSKLGIMFMMMIICLLTNKQVYCDEGIKLTIEKLIVEKGTMQINYSLFNNSKYQIWFCTDIDAGSEIDYEVKIDKKKLIISFKSIVVPPYILLEEPIWAKYLRLEPGKKFNDSIKVSIPVSEIKYFEENKSSKEVWVQEYANTVALVVGVYEINLEKNKEACCRDDSNSYTSFVSCFWAEENKERLIKSEIKNQKILTTILR
jgi:hypothetical protein